MSAGLRPGQLLAMVMVHRKGIAIAAVSTALFLGLLAKFVLPKIYESSATVLIDFEVNNPVSGREFPAQLATSYLSTQQAIIQSDRVLLPSIDRLGWITDADRRKGYRGETPAGLREWLANKALSAKLSVKAYKDTRLIDISFEDKDPVIAAKVVNTVAQVFIETQSEASGGFAKERAREYEEQLLGLRAKIAEAQQKVAEFRSKTGLLEFEPTGGVDAERLAALNSQLTQLQVDNGSAQARANTARQTGQNPQALDSGLVQQLKSRVLELELNFTQISRELGPRHPDYIAVQKQLADARQSLARETGNYSSSLQGQASTASASEAAVLKEVQEQRRRLLTIREQQDQGALLVRDVEAAKRVYEIAVASYDKVVAPSESKFSNISLVNPGVPALQQSRPFASSSALFGLLGGGIVALLAALLWELTHRRIHCAMDIEDLLADRPLIKIGPTT